MSTHILRTQNYKIYLTYANFCGIFYQYACFCVTFETSVGSLRFFLVHYPLAHPEGQYGLCNPVHDSCYEICREGLHRVVGGFDGECFGLLIGETRVLVKQHNRSKGVDQSG